MLLLPLHKPLNVQTMPWVSLLLIMVNSLIYFGIQARSDIRLMAAIDYYAEQNLAEHEFPAYASMPKEASRERAWQSVQSQPEVLRNQATLMMLQEDPDFQALRRRGGVVAADQPQFDAYQSARSEFDRRWQQGDFTLRYAQRSGDWDLGRMISACFLHGGIGHLLGNMVMLLIVALLVERALGALWYILLYLLSGVMGNVLSTALADGGYGISLGASGAIAGLMGALPVLWGMRRVRVFVWIGFYFNYVKVPALVLLPVWLGKELYSMATLDVGVDFAAHAGGMIGGALLAWLLVQTRKTRDDFLSDTASDPKVASAAASDASQQQARLSTLLRDGMAAMGRLEFAQAHRLLGECARHRPQDLSVLLPAYRAARYGAGPEQAATAAKRVLLVQNVPNEQKQELHALWLDLGKRGARPELAVNELLLLARTWSTLGFVDSALEVLAQLFRHPQRTQVDRIVLVSLLKELVAELTQRSDPRLGQVQTALARLSASSVESPKPH